jgi:uncharacterized protein YkwD
VVLATAPVDARAEPAIELSLVHPHPPVVESLQAQALFDDVNAERSRHGLHALVWDPRLERLALHVAREMAERHYFGHTDPNGVSFEDRLRANGYHYRFAAENMAFDQDEAHANQAFLHSPGHYANIVDPTPTRLGVAVVSAGDGEVFYVEEFME